MPDPAHFAGLIAGGPQKVHFRRVRVLFGPHVAARGGRCFVVVQNTLETPGGEAVSVGVAQSIEEYVRQPRGSAREGLPPFGRFAEAVGGLRALPNFAFVDDEDVTAAYAALLTRGSRSFAEN